MSGAYFCVCWQVLEPLVVGVVCPYRATWVSLASWDADYGEATAWRACVFAPRKRGTDGRSDLKLPLGEDPRLRYLGALGGRDLGLGGCLPSIVSSSGGGLRGRATEGAGPGLWASGSLLSTAPTASPSIHRPLWRL